MHIDYAKEVYENGKTQQHGPQLTDQEILESLATDDLVDYCAVHGSEKIKSISKTMQGSCGYRNVSNRVRKRITAKQRYAIAKFLMDTFGSAPAALANVFNTDETYFKTEQTA